MSADANMNPSPPLVFVYLGGQLPSYAEASLRFASRNHSGDVILLSESLADGSNAFFQTFNIRPWYDASRFEKFEAKSSLERQFRGGFWLYAVERFFVLEQFMGRRGLERIFHAELDVMVFGLEGVSQACDRHGSGIFSVMDSPIRSLASLFYVNSRRSFQDFLAYLLDAPATLNEMQLLGEYTQANPSRAHALPSEIALDSANFPLAPSSVDPAIGIFDAAALGQWLFGIDPRNTSGSVWNHYRNPNLTFPIEQARFSMARTGLPKVEFLGLERPIRTLHIHSKVVERLVRSSRLRFWLRASALPFPLLVERKTGVVRGVLLERLLIGRGLALVKGLNTRFPRLIASMVTYLRENSARPLSRRQLAEVEAILRGPSHEK